MGIRWTEIGIGNLKWSGHGDRDVFVHPKQDGLRLVVYKSGRKTWFVRFRGTDNKIGQYPELGLKDAISICRKEIEQARRISLPKMTFGQYLTEIHLPKAKAKTAPQRAQDLQRAFKNSKEAGIHAPFWTLPLSNLHRLAIEDWRDEYQEAFDLANGTLNSLTQFWRASLNKAVERKLLASNPFDGIKQLPESDPRVRYLLDDERERFFTVLRARKDFLKPFCIVALNTGMRRQELLSIEYEHLNFEARIIKIPITKAQKAQTVPMNDKTVNALHEWIAANDIQSGLIFANESGQMRHGRMKIWDRFVQACQIKDFRIHDMRHDYASRLVMNGIPIYDVMRLMRHSSIKLTERYAHLRPERLLDAVNTL